MTLDEVMVFVHANGIVLESARGPVPSVAGFIAGAPMVGSWWSHPRGREIFQLTRALRDSDDILVCRLVGGNITFIHRRLWPAVVRVANQLPHHALARLHETHTPSGRHVVTQTAFPTWVPADVLVLGGQLAESDAWATLRAQAAGAFGAS